MVWAAGDRECAGRWRTRRDRKSTRLNSSHPSISYAAAISTLSLHDALPICRPLPQVAERAGERAFGASEEDRERTLETPARPPLDVECGPVRNEGIDKWFGRPETANAPVAGGPAEIGRAHV